MNKIKKLIGQRFGRLAVIKEAGGDKWKNVLWLCKCDCGNEKVIKGGNLIKGITQSCGCYNKERVSETHLKNLTGKRFGRLVVLKEAGRNRWRAVMWLCKCDCGDEEIVRSGNLISGDTQSCGCLHRKTISKLFLKNLIGQRFERLVVIEEAGRSKQGKALWLCKCDCGAKKVINASSLMFGATKSCGCLQKERVSKAHLGENNFNWKGGITPLNLAIRGCTENLNWKLDVFARDGFKCQHCKDATKRKLNAHHKKSFAKIIQGNNITTLDEARVCKELWDIDNGITLCEECHKLEHKRIKYKEFEININLN